MKREHVIIAAALAGAFLLPFMLFPETVALPKDAPAQEQASNSIDYDAKAADRSQMLDQGEAGMSVCFDRAMSGLLRGGVRDRSQIIEFATNTCGSGYQKQMVMAGASDDAANAYIGLAATRQLDAILQRGR